PEGILILRNRSAPRQGREAERYVITFLIGHGADGGVNHQLRCSIWRPAAANDLFNQPTVASRDRRGDEEAYDLPLPFGHEDAAIDQSLQGLRFNQKMHRRQPARRQPLLKALLQGLVSGGL